MSVTTIDAWNHLNVTLRAVPGTYQPGIPDGVARDVTLAAD